MEKEKTKKMGEHSPRYTPLKKRFRATRTSPSQTPTSTRPSNPTQTPSWTPTSSPKKPRQPLKCHEDEVHCIFFHGGNAENCLMTCGRGKPPEKPEPTLPGELPIYLMIEPALKMKF